MATKKVTETKTATVKTSTAPAAKDTEAKKTTTVTETKAAEPAKKTAAKKAPAKKTTTAAKKPAAKKVTTKKVATELYVQFAGHEVSEESMVERVKEAWESEGNKVSSIKEISLYVKPEEHKVYYVINKSAAGALDI